MANVSRRARTNFAIMVMLTVSMRLRLTNRGCAVPLMDALAEHCPLAMGHRERAFLVISALNDGAPAARDAMLDWMSRRGVRFLPEKDHGSHTAENQFYDIGSWRLGSANGDDALKEPSLKVFERRAGLRVSVPLLSSLVGALAAVGRVQEAIATVAAGRTWGYPLGDDAVGRIVQAARDSHGDDYAAHVRQALRWSGEVRKGNEKPPVPRRSRAGEDWLGGWRSSSTEDESLDAFLASSSSYPR